MDPKPFIFLLGVAAVAWSILVSYAARDWTSALFWYRSSSLWTFISMVRLALWTLPICSLCAEAKPLYVGAQTSVA